MVDRLIIVNRKEEIIMLKNNNKSNLLELEKYLFYLEKIEDFNNKMKRIN